MKTSEVKRALNPKRKALLWKMRMGEQLIVGFIHVNEMRSHFIGSPLRKRAKHIGDEGRRHDELILLDVLIEREDVLLGRGVVGREETEIEVVLLDGDVQHETDPAHTSNIYYREKVSYKFMGRHQPNFWTPMLCVIYVILYILTSFYAVLWRVCMMRYSKL